MIEGELEVLGKELGAWDTEGAGDLEGNPEGDIDSVGINEGVFDGKDVGCRLTDGKGTIVGSGVEGTTEGTVEDNFEGGLVGFEVGAAEGKLEEIVNIDDESDAPDVKAEGNTEFAFDGRTEEMFEDGLDDATMEGVIDGVPEGLVEESSVGGDDGANVGNFVGFADGSKVGMALRVDEGLLDCRVEGNLEVAVVVLIEGTGVERPSERLDSLVGVVEVIDAGPTTEGGDTEGSREEIDRKSTV